MAKKNVPLSARERNGIIALLTAGLTLIGGGFLVRQLNSSSSLNSGIVATSDTDTLDLLSESGYEVAPEKTTVKKGNRTRNDSTPGTFSGSKKAHKKTTTTGKQKTSSAGREKPAPPPRSHLEEGLNE